jgi:hypothetical protein
VATGDFNGDGNVDLVTANWNSHDLSVVLATGTGTFQPEQRFAVGFRPNRANMDDLNGDGNLDLVIGDDRNPIVSLLFGTGGGMFGAAQTLPLALGSSPTDVATADVNDDGKIDLLILADSQGSTEVLVLLGNGNGTFQAEQRVIVGSTANMLTVSDVDDDGHLDLVLLPHESASGGGRVTILLGTGAGTFGSPQSFGVGGGTSGAAVADLNGDGQLDLAASGGFFGQEGRLLILLHR